MKPRAVDICINPIQPGDIALLCQRMGADDGAGHWSYADRQSRDEGVYLIAWGEEVPVAHLFICWTGNTEVPRIVERYPQAAQFADCPEFCEVYVVAERRSQGIGTKLFRRALQLACGRGASQATICVDTDNPRAQSLYERLGFVESRRGSSRLS